MIYVSHRLDEVFEIADRMVVLRDGRVVGERRVAETTPEETILMIVGREPSQVFRRAAEGHGPARLRARRASRAARSARSICTLHAGRDRRAGRAARRGAGARRAARCSVWLAPSGGRITAGRCADRAALPRARRWRRGSSSSGATARAAPSCRSSRCAENLFLNPLAAGLSPFAYLAPRPRDARRRSASAHGSACARTTRRCRSRRSRAATSRRSWSGAGCICAARSTSSRTPRPASMSAPRPRSTACSTSRCSRAPPSCSSRPISRRSRISATARWSSTAARVVAELAAARAVGRTRCSPRPPPASARPRLGPDTGTA